LKRIMPILLLAVGGVLVYLYMTGKLSGLTSQVPATGDPAAIANQGVQKAKDTGTAIYAQPWFWTAVMAAAGATFLRAFWNRLGGFGRMSIGVVIAVLATVFVLSVGGHR
jgi:hypothetical protein